ncbi:hypothetical protein PLICRDRAFT_36691 [Plicaturopsis crispa FD-325 SS-3]|nr:hypothetical protein PLICRDRAFT_36691 [Plicaturopsis crispa FD-325 SS-3]
MDGPQFRLYDFALTDQLEYANNIWSDSAAIPAYAAAASLIVLLAHALVTSRLAKKIYSHDEPDTDARVATQTAALGFGQRVKEHVASLGGATIFAYQVARAIGCFALLGLSLATLVKGTEGEIEHAYANESNVPWLLVASSVTYAYASLLGALSVALKPKSNRQIPTHLTLVLLIAWSVYFYRDIWPLATYNLVPRDSTEGWLVWSKAIILSVIAVVIPLVSPRRYVPLNPDEPCDPNPSQTSSLLSLVTYSCLDYIVYRAYFVDHLKYEELPPLADTDQARNLTKEGSKYLDPFKTGRKNQGLFLPLVKVFRRDLVVMAFVHIFRAFISLASPIGLNRLLTYLETGGEGATVRPWVWILWLFFGPLLNSLAVHWWQYISFRAQVRMEAMMTQLIFEHSLRIRMVADAPESSSLDSSAAATPAATTPDSASATEEAANTLRASTSETVVESTSGETVAGSTGDAKGKSKSEYTAEDAEKPPAAPATSGNLVGKINNLVSTDLAKLTSGRDFLLVVFYMPIQAALCTLFLYQILGWSSFVGLAFMVAMLPVPVQLAKTIEGTQAKAMKKSDARVQSVSETMSVIRMIKLFGWEKKMSDRLDEKRQDELTTILRRKMYTVFIDVATESLAPITMIITFVTYTVVMKRELDSARVFSAIAVFMMLRSQLFVTFYQAPQVMQAKVSLNRIAEFLSQTELLDEFTEKPENATALSPPTTDGNLSIGFRDATFAWSSADGNEGAVTPSQRKFKLRIDGEVIFKRGGINLLIGPTGCGKTSVLMALLGEMHFEPSGPSSWYNLPRSGGIAYAAQESWVQNETIRDNILFGSPYDEARYKKVIHQCALKRDIDLFDAGDATEVGEKGLTLSQQARVTLARAVYSSAEILLLDDVLAALDVHTSKWIVEKCFAGDLVRGRTVILITHNVAMASPIADYVVALGIDGRIASQGTISDVLSADPELSAQVAKEVEVERKAEEEIDLQAGDETAEGDDTEKQDGKLTVAEEIQIGHVSWPSLKLYFSSLGGSHIALFWVLLVLGYVGSSSLDAAQTWWLGYWASQYEVHPSDEVAVPLYLSVYAVLLIVGLVIIALTQILFLFGSMKASTILHRRLIHSVLHTTLRWLDKTPVSRDELSEFLWRLVEVTAILLVRFIAVAAYTPLFVVLGIFGMVAGSLLGHVYMKAQLSVKREQSNAKAPVLGHFGGAIAGLTSIRAYGAQVAFEKESKKRIDRYNSASRVVYDLNRWFTVRIDALSGIFAAFLAAYFVYFKDNTHARDTGFSLNMAAAFGAMIMWWVRLFNLFETQGAVERIHGYLTIEQEQEPSEGGVPPAYWPASGDICVENLSAKYSPDGPTVLHDISFHIKSGERVGVVGRTGSGKSSLTLSLLRCIFTEGTVYYDGIPTSSVNLDTLRSNITIIPQVPELLSGSLRQNLDPFSQYDDATLNDALRAAGLYSLQNDDGEHKITLDSTIASGGGNLSVGQRQILALARAIVRGSKLLILDEDYETDAVIQSSLRNELKGDVTLLTVAHRLQTIMDADKIMVLDAGRVVEYNSPAELLKNEKGFLRALVDESGDKEKLYAMASEKSI